VIITALGAPTSPCSDLSRRQKSIKKKGITKNTKLKKYNEEEEEVLRPTH
jgi:hypothetical protein